MLKKIIALALSIIMVISALTILVNADTTNSGSETVTPADPADLAAQLTDAVSELEHPYVLYSKEEIPALQKKTESGMSKKAYAVVKATAISCKGQSLTVNSNSSGVIGRQLQYFVSYLSIYSMLSSDESFAKKAVDLAVSAATQGNNDIYLGINDALCIADFGYAYALAYDQLYNYLTDEQRQLLKTEMEDIGAWIYENSAKLKTWGSPERRRNAWNWNAVTHGALGMIALSLGGHEDWLALSIERMEGYYAYAVDATGAAMEGLHYIGYAFNSLAPLDHAIYRLSGVEVMDAYPAMQSMPYWSMNMTAPQGGEQAAINQGDGIGNYSGPYYIINRYNLSDALWGWEHTYNLSGDGKFSTEYQGNGWSAPAIILFENQSLTPTEPTEENNPLVTVYKKGLVIARDSWEKDAAMMTFTCGIGYSGCWNHPDDNSFTFYAKGESFIIDLGAGKVASSDHNVVLFNGKGMDYSGGATMIEGDLQEASFLDNGNYYVRGDNKYSYAKSGVTASTRQIVFGGGDTPFVLVFDYMKVSGADNTYTTNFYTKTTSTVSVDKSGEFATITGKNNGAVCYVIPYSTNGVKLTAVNAPNKAITTESKSSFHRQATLFITANPDGSMPQAEFSEDGKNTTVKITRVVNGETVTEEYVFALQEILSPEIYEETTETETVITETTEETTQITEEITTDKTENDSEISETKEATTEEATTEEATQTTEKNESSSGGCGSVLTFSAIIPAAIAATAIAYGKKKKDCNR